MDRRLRIMFALGSLGGGGTERQVLLILRHLDRRRFDPVLYLIYRTGELLAEVPPDIPIRCFGERWERPRWNFPGWLRRQQIAHLAQTLAAENIDLVYDRTIHATLVAGEAARRASRPHLSVVVNDPRLDLEASGQKFVRMKRRLLRAAYRDAAGILAVSEGVREAVIAYYGLPPHLVNTVYNLFDFEELERRSQEPGPAWDDGQVHLVAAGRFQEQKGFSILLKALKLLRQRPGQAHVCLHLLGQGPLEGALRAEVERLGLRSHVAFEGFHTNPLPYYRRADVFCLPSLFEGMPNALVEALALGTPVVASDCPSGPREILQDGQLGVLVAPGDASRLAEALDTVLQAQAFWRTRTADARRELEERFSIRAGMDRLQEAFLRSRS